MSQAFKFRIALLVLLCTGGLMFASAEESTDDGLPEEGSEDYLCGKAMLDQGASVVANYEVFLDEYFKVDTPSSGQFEGALNMYRFTEMSVNAIYEANLNIDTAADVGKTLDDANRELTYCSYVRDAYLNYIKTLFRRQFTGSTSYKVTFKVVDGLKVMNEDLGDLSTLFGETFPVLFTKMNNAFSCYTESCATQ